MDERWAYFGVTAAYLELKAPWLQEERNLHQQSVHFFRLAGKLVSLSRDDYELASLAFFQAIIGLERALRLRFSAEATDRFAELLGRAVAEEMVTDAVFSEVRPIPKELRRHFKSTAPTHCHALATLVPKLRNEFMHGTYLLSPEYLHLTFQMREIADALTTKTM